MRFVAVDAIVKQTIDSLVESGEPGSGLALNAGIIGDNFLTMPIEHENDVDPA